MGHKGRDTEKPGKGRMLKGEGGWEVAQKGEFEFLKRKSYQKV